MCLDNGPFFKANFINKNIRTSEEYGEKERGEGGGGGLVVHSIWDMQYD